MQRGIPELLSSQDLTGATAKPWTRAWIIEIDGIKYASVVELIDAKLDVFSAETINSVVGLIADLLKDVDDNLLSVGYLLDVDVVGLKNYECTAEITDVKSFAKELANILTTYAGGLVNWLFFADDFRFAKKSDNTDTIVINGGLGYEKADCFTGETSCNSFL